MDGKKALNLAWYVVAAFIVAVIVLMLIASRIGL